MSEKEEYLEKEEYIGDGLYAKFDGYHIILRAPREEGDHWVGLNPTVLQNLFAFLERLSPGVIARLSK